MPLVIGLLVGLTVLVAGYEALPLRRPVAAAQLRELAGAEEEEVPLLQAIAGMLGRVLAPLLPSTTLASLEQRLYWARFQGQFVGWTGAMFYALVLLLGVGGFMVGLMLFRNRMLLALLVGLVGVLLPYRRLRKASEGALRQIRRMLPDFADRIALEVVGGATIESALRNVLDYPGLLGEFLRRCDLEAGTLGARLLDTARRRAGETGIPELLSLFVKLSEIERQGVDAAQRIVGLAQDMRRIYLSGVRERAKALGGKMVPVLLIFFVLPFIALVVAPLLSGVLKLFRAGG